MTTTKESSSASFGSQEDLYAIALLAWGYCLKQLALFSKESPRYTNKLADEAIAKVNKAKKMPSREARNEAFKTAKITLLERKVEVANLWQKLKVFIEEAYQGKDQQNKLEAAGAKDYTAMGGTNDGKWTDCVNLIDNTKLFLTDFGNKLMEKDNMPGDFQAQFEAAGDAFVATQKDYNDKRDLAAEDIGAKDKIDEEIYAELRTMLKMGQQIFRNDPLYLPDFVYAKLKKKVRGNSPSGVKGKVLSMELEKPIGGAAWYDKDGNLLATTDKLGKYEFKIASGDYTFTVIAKGYETVKVTKQVEVGTIGRANLLMKKEMEIAPAMSEKTDPAAAPDAAGSGIFKPVAHSLQQEVKTENGVEV